MSDAIYVNGNHHSWGSIRAKVNGDEYHGFSGITFADARERVKAYGLGRHHAPRGRSRGKYTVENVKVTGFKSSMQVLREELAKQSSDGKSYGDVEFTFLVDYFEADELQVTVELGRCVFAKNSTGDDENPDPLKEEVEFDCMYIRRNGLVLYDSSQGGPA